MTHKEQIIEVLKKHIGECAISGDDADYLLFHLTKDILSLPIDVPSEEEIKTEANKVEYRNIPTYDTQRVTFKIAVKWTINEILKRNKIE